MERPITCSIVVPVYNSAASLEALVTRLAQVLPTIASEYEMILVNDGSQDTSWEVITRLAEQHPWLRGINLMRNYGQHNATLCGVRSARFEIIVTMDDDLQHPPEEIPALLNKLNEGYDVVYGVPHKRPHSWWRNWFSILTKRILAQVMGIRTIRDIGAFRAFRARLRDAFRDYGNSNVILDVLLSWGTARFTTVIVNENKREVGQSNYNFLKLFRVTMVVLTGFSTVPLRFASMLGFGFTLFGLLVFLYVLAATLLQGSIPGFPFLASIIALFSGTQLFALGIIGEYLARIFDRSMDRPAYMIGEETGAMQAPDRALPETAVQPQPEGSWQV